jgi:NAD(P)-dependent dehydrogenase (short-subunit alcohol dehydrogenase family)
MKELKDKVAVVTGGGSGIGRSMAMAFAAEGMKIVLADVREDALATVRAELEGNGAQVHTVIADVSDAVQVQRIADETTKRFGAVNIVCNNAGVAAGGFTWELSLEDWEWVVGVNLWGVIHGVRTFVPMMIEQGDECHIVNTASLAGLISMPLVGPYHVTKHGVVTLTEALYHELQLMGHSIGASVLCPAWVKTNIMNSPDLRPAGPMEEGEITPPMQMMQAAMNSAIHERGMNPDDVAQRVLDAVREGQLYILTHPQFSAAVTQRAEGIVAESNPVYDPSVMA